MDGFNVIPVQSEAQKSPAPKEKEVSIPQSEPTILTRREEVKTPLVTKPKKSSSGFLFPLGILSFLGVFCYFLYLVFVWSNSLTQIGTYSSLMAEQRGKIDKAELEEFLSLDKTLKSINSRLAGHILNTEILNYINSNMRNSLTVTDYTVDVKENEISLSFNSISPSFKDMAEQTERLFALKAGGDIKSFAITNVSLESDSRRLRFTVNITLDKRRFSAVARSAQNNI